MKTLQEIVTVTTKNIGITVKLDYQKNTISIINPNQNYTSKKFIFAERGIEYMNGWLNIIEAIEEAIKFAKYKMEKHLVEKEKEDIEMIIKVAEAMEKSKPLELEEHNFRVDSSNWPERNRSGFRIKENGKQDIIEFTEGELKGEQLFTWEAAIRETKKAGKRMPTRVEFEELVEDRNDVKNIIYTGSRNTDSSFDEQGTETYLWTSSESGAGAWTHNLSSSGAAVYRNTDDKANLFSVRCLKI